MRLFVAIELPLAVRAKLGELIDRLSLVHEPVKWVEESNLHLTVKFLGEVDEAKLPDLRAALDRAARGVAPFEGALRGVGAYPNPKHPRVVWAGLEAPPALAALAEKVEAEFGPLGFPPEARPFSAHVTLGRAKEGHQTRRPRKGRTPADEPGPLLSEAVAQEAAFSAGVVAIDRLTLFQSKLGKGGPTYTAVHEAKLGP